MSARDPNTGQFVASGGLDDEPVLNENFAVQARNVDRGGFQGDAGRFRFTNVLEEITGEPISPQRGELWHIHQIDYAWYWTSEDDSDDNLSEHMQVLYEISEDDTPTAPFSSGATLNGTEIDGMALDAVGGHGEGSWVSQVGDGTVNMHNAADGMAGGSASPVKVNSGTFRPPGGPIMISHRTELDVHFAGGNSNTSSASGDDAQMFGTAVTVWYQAEEGDDSIR